MYIQRCYLNNLVNNMYSYSDILYQCIFSSYLWLSGEHINVYILLCQVIYMSFVQNVIYGRVEGESVHLHAL